MGSKPELRVSGLFVGFLLSSPSTRCWSCTNFRAVPFTQWDVGKKIHPYLPSHHNSCGIAKSTACVVEQLFISLGYSCVYSRVCVSSINHDYTPCIYICGWSPGAVKASGQRNDTEKCIKSSGQALGVGMTAPGAQPELQAGKGTWLLIDHKWFNIFCGRSCCEVPDSSSTDSEGRELRSHFLWHPVSPGNGPLKQFWLLDWLLVVPGAASTVSGTDLCTLLPSHQVSPCTRLCLSLPCLLQRFPAPGFPTCALEKLRLQFLSRSTGPQDQSWE